MSYSALILELRILQTLVDACINKIHTIKPKKLRREHHEKIFFHFLDFVSDLSVINRLICLGETFFLFLCKTYHFLGAIEMRRSFILLQLCVTLTYNNLLNAQTALVNPHSFFFQNETAFYVNGSLEAAEDKVLGGDVGVVINQMFDLGVGIGRLTTNDELAQSFGLAAFHVSPHITFFPISQNNVFPLSIGITGGYSYISFSSPLLNDAGLQLNMSDLTFQLNAFSGIEINPNSSFVIGGSVVYISRALNIEDNIGNSEKVSQNEVGFNIHGGFRFNTSPKNYFYLSPKLTIIDNSASFSLTAGIGFGRTKSVNTNHSRTSGQRMQGWDDLLNVDEFTQLPYFRAAVPNAKNYTDYDILRMFREKFPNLRSRTDEELIRLIEKKYARKSQD